MQFLDYAPSNKKSSWFTRLASHASRAAGYPITFIVAVSTIVIWALLGPVFGFSDTWQLVINTGTTIVTFLMVFLIQNTQNRDTEAIQVKLDELIRATQGAHNALLDLEEMEEDQLDAFRERYEALATAAREQMRHGRSDTGSPELQGTVPEEVVSEKTDPKTGRHREAQ